MRELVQSLQGCLASLPDRLRLVLELRTGVGVPNALEPGTVAAELRVAVQQVPSLENSALRQLRVIAATDACGQESQLTLLPSDFVEAFVSARTSGSGGVAGVKYSKSPAGSGAIPASPSSSLLGATLPGHPGSPLLWVVVTLAGLTTLAFLLADGLGTGPRHRHWRSRWISAPIRALRNRGR